MKKTFIKKSFFSIIVQRTPETDLIQAEEWNIFSSYGKQDFNLFVQQYRGFSSSCDSERGSESHGTSHARMRGACLHL